MKEPGLLLEISPLTRFGHCSGHCGTLSKECWTRVVAASSFSEVGSPESESPGVSRKAAGEADRPRAAKVPVPLPRLEGSLLREPACGRPDLVRELQTPWALGVVATSPLPLGEVDVGRCPRMEDGRGATGPRPQETRSPHRVGPLCLSWAPRVTLPWGLERTRRLNPK